MTVDTDPTYAHRMSYARSIGGPAAANELKDLVKNGADEDVIEKFIASCRERFGASFSLAIGIDTGGRTARFGCSRIVIDDE